jgi:Ser/Thr protein kinase RdoA (MazF antagonist)
MNDYYQCSAQEQGRRMREVAEKALPLWPVDPAAQIDLVALRENAVFRVSTAEAQYALRVHRANYHSDDQLASEFMWTSALNSDQLRVPQPLPARSGASFEHVSVASVPEVRQVDLLEWFDGEPLGELADWIESGPEAAREGLAMAGRLMAIAHNQSESWTPPAGFTRRTWDQETLLGANPFWGRYWELDALDDGLRQRLKTLEPIMAAELADMGRDADRYGVIHADFLPDNILRKGDEVYLIDFDDAGYSWYLLDLACLTMWFYGDDHYEAALAALLDGYREQRAMPPCDLDHLPVFMIMRAMGVLAFCHVHRESEVAQAIRPVVLGITAALCEDYAR